LFKIQLFFGLIDENEKWVLLFVEGDGRRSKLCGVKMVDMLSLLVRIKRELGDAEVDLNKSLIESLFERVSRTC